MPMVEIGCGDDESQRTEPQTHVRMEEQPKEELECRKGTRDLRFETCGEHEEDGRNCDDAIERMASES